jgi:ribonuclease VapC
MVIEGGWGRDQGKDLDLLLHTFQVETVAFDATQGELARSAWQEFGKGRHPAALNLGDCCVYALAELRGEPILAKGNDFARTPIQVVALDRP